MECLITYPKVLRIKLLRRIWKMFFCRYGWHLWRETKNVKMNYIRCDACEEVIGILKE